MKKFGKMRMVAAIALVAAFFGSSTSVVADGTGGSNAPAGFAAESDAITSANTISYRMMAIGNDSTLKESPANYDWVTEADLSDDSSDGDGKSLRLDNGDVFMPSFGMLPHGMNYRLSFKYKRKSDDGGDRLSIYLDNMNPSLQRVCYADGVSGGSASEWTSYSYDFNATSGQTDITFLRIASYGTYLIDELQINTLNEYVLNGAFEKSNYYQQFTVDKTAITVDNTVSDDYGKSLKLEAGKGYRIEYSMTLPKGAQYRLSFKYKKLNTSEIAGKYNGGEYSGNGLLIFHDGYTVDESHTRFYDMGYNNPAELNQWQEFSREFYALPDDTVAETAPIHYAAFVPCYGDYLIDDISVECIDDSFLDVQFLAGGNFGGAYLENYAFYGKSNFNFAKQSDGAFAFASMHTTWDAGSKVRGYFHVLTDMLEKGKEYELSFEYYANGTGVEVVGVYNGAAGDGKRIVSINTPVTKWTNHTVIFTAEKDFLEVYGSAYGQNSTFIRNIQITDKTSGKTYITNQSLIAPDVRMIKNGASIRTSEPYGIRWAAGVRTDFWNKLVETYGAENVKAGVIVAPLDTLENVTEFTIETMKNANLSYADIVTDTFNATVSGMVQGYSGFYASLVNIKEGNLNRSFAARAYVSVEKDGETTYYYGEYSAENQARSIYEVSKSVIVSTTENEAVKEFAKGVLNKVAEITVANGNAALATIEGYTSPYTVSLEGSVLTIKITDEASAAKITDIKVVCVNGKNYKPAVSGNTVTVTID